MRWLLRLLPAGLGLWLAADAAAEVVPSRALLADPTQRYALFVPDDDPPSGPQTQRRPLLLLFDPRGRGLETLELFRPAAEDLGWIVASSYETRSDAEAGPGGERNHRAIPALLEDVQRRHPIDPRRIYLAGMSGTARVAWAYALGLGDHAAGVFAAAGGLPGNQAPRATSFAYFGAAGFFDFNYAEMRALDRAFDGVTTHRFEYFAGEHAWPPSDLVERGLRWLELRAMVEGRRPVDRELARTLVADEWAEIQRVMTQWPHLALDRAEQTLQDAGALARLQPGEVHGLDLDPLTREYEAWSRDPRVQRAREAEREQLALEEGYRQTLAVWQAAFLQAETILPHARSLSMLRVAALRQESDATDPGRAATARRRLGSALALISGELTARLRQSDDRRRLAAAWALAVEMAPRAAWAHAELARARAQLGSWRQARADFARALELGLDPATAIDQDPLWEKLAAPPRP